ncbi:16S rRNA (cytosine(1402)-N(4))-methyltransferase RsmH [Blattabacterium cuenoti]|uniref:16S rRNA (cytosine(1402)-N(4))-methyltransferase RsmH n=1 Tax=Blattabacterium cuenoti TaxID=1653831 RepID=UPI001EEB9123|nr:16S rRNA (cytosine(1402)-N(4))-methyltransferase RsmH [Blattabacterium cuenoti]
MKEEKKMIIKYFHKPVLTKKSVNNLLTDKNGIYIDATFGGGGHSSYMLKKLNINAKLIAIDQDKDAIKSNLIKDPRLHLFHNNFVNIKDILNKKIIGKISGILIDLGCSFFQLSNPKRGFSYKLHCILDMRMNQDLPYSAQNVVNESSKQKLYKIFHEYGDFKNAIKIADIIIKKRKDKKIITNFELMNLFLIKGNFKKRKRFFSRLFQSIRIEVNNEINILKYFLLKSYEILSSKGRIAVISYHSTEDRIIKHFFKNLSFKIINKKVFKPSKKEIENNSKSRSAKLRIAEKI